MKMKYKYKVRHKIVTRLTPVGHEHRTECGHAVLHPERMLLKTKDMEPCGKCFSKEERATLAPKEIK